MEEKKPDARTIEGADAGLTIPDQEQAATVINTIVETNVSDRDRQEGDRTTTIDIPGYRILEKLGQGGMGSVFLAVDQNLGRRVAIKVISHTALHSKRSVARFAAEIQTVAALKHPNIAQLYSAGEKDEVPFYVMEFVDGPTLDEKIGASPMEPRDAASLLHILAGAMEYCHQQGIVHRDLKPSNILMDQDQPRIADFGLAKALESDNSTTRTGEILGTPAYMAPEQASGETDLIGPATDVYGLGAIFYHALTGRAPFSAPNSVNTISQVISDDPISPRRLQKGVPKDIETICLKCLEKNPVRRYESAQLLAEDFQRFLDERPIQARPISGVERVLKWTRRRPTLAALLLLMAIAIPATIAGLIYHSSRLDAALKRETQALAEADVELKRSSRLSSEGSELSTWLLGEHTSQLRRLTGATKIRYEMNQRIREYLDRSVPDMPRTAKFIRRFGNAYHQLGMSLGGESESSLGSSAEAEQLIGKSIELFDQALTIDPDDTYSKNLKINSLLALSELQTAHGRNDEADTSITNARELFDSITNDRSRDRRMLRVSLLQAEYSQLHNDQQLEGALKKLEELASAIEDGPEDPLIDEELIHQKIWMLRQRGRVLRESGEYEEAEHVFKQGIELAQPGYETDPKNPLVLERYAGLLIDRADVKSNLEEHEAALELLLAALELRQQYADQNPDDAFSKFNLASAISRVDSAYLQVQNPVKQLEFSRRAAQLNRELADDHPENRIYQRNLAIALNALAAALNLNQEIESAQKNLDEALKLAQELADQSESGIADLGLVAEIQNQKAMFHFSRLMSEDGSGDIKENANYKSALDFFDKSLATYERMDEIGELNFQQENIRENVRNGKKLLLDAVEQLQNIGEQ